MKKPETQMIRSALSLSVLFFMVAAVWAEPDLTECAREKSDAARLACYDRMAEDAIESDQQAYDLKVPADQHTEDAEAVVSDAAAPESDIAADETAGAIDNFGMNRNVAEANEKTQPKLDQIYASIVDIETRSYGKRVITLDNGQVWVEESPSKSVRLEPGDKVRIKAGVLGSFRLFGANRRSTRVERIQ